MTKEIRAIENARPNFHVWMGLTPDPEEIPDALKRVDQWVVWRAEPKPDGRRSKVPYAPSTGRRASSTDPRTWSDWPTAWGAYEEAPEVYAGVGFVLTESDQFVGIDLDHCVDGATGIPTTEAANIVERCDTYAEKSPSGTGVRIIGYGAQITAACPERGIELYCNARFLTITGRRLTSADPSPVPEAVLQELAAEARGVRREAGSFDQGATVSVDATQVRDLRSALAAMRSDDRDLWVRMGMALKEFGDVGRGLWLEWSQTSEKYNPADAARVWDSLQPERTGYAAVFAAGKRSGWVNPKGQERPESGRAQTEVPPESNARSVASSNSVEARTSDGWPQPKPITADLLPVPAFDAEVLLPSPLREWVMDEADRMPCPPDYVAAAVVVELGSVIGARCAIRPKSQDDWEVVTNLWGGAVGPPSAKKTPAVNAALKPLGQLIEQASAEHQNAEAEFEITETILDARKGALDKKIKDAAKAGKQQDLDKFVAEWRDFRDEAPVPPILRRYKTNDTTVEKLGELLRDNPRGVLVQRDELVGLVSVWDKDGREGDRAFFLEGWNGISSFDTDRIKRGSIFIPNLCVSIFGGIQPDKLTRYLEQAQDALANDGMLQRFQVLVYPDDPTWEWRNRGPDIEVRRRIFGLFEAIADFNPEAWGALPADEGAKFPYFVFDERAQEVFIEWSEELHRVRLRNEEDPIIGQHLAKYDKLFPALAHVFHLVDCAVSGGRGQVTPEAALRAAAWCEYLEGHARRCYGLLADDGLRAAQALAAKIAKGQLAEGFTARDVRRHQWSYLKSGEAVEAALDWLEDDGWIRSEDVMSGSSGGRPKVLYHINPAARAGRGPGGENG
ncbi:MAG: DUF3987 domain-containing protein [Pseudomonadota bacterium]|nr:DUF3987 domain-containing protein [Pseudomonadota bacterium]